ncbi:MAG TPA: PAS domain S-box protein [Thermomicrobiales bacterium]|nr:PAS domain S-box protein [Thermomicrobiales bacterium]
MSTRIEELVELADVLQQPIWTVRPDGTVDYANAFWRAYTGLDQAAIASHGWASAVHSDDLPVIADRWNEASDSGQPYETEYRFRDADGLYRWHVARVAPLRSPDGSILRWVGIAIDIDDRRQAEEDLRASEARYRDVVDYADDIVYTLNPDGLLIAINPAVRGVLGYTPEELIGTSIESIIAPDEVAISRGKFHEKLTGDHRSSYELDVIAKDGRRVTLDINNRLVMPEDRPVVIHGIARDISRRRERTRQAELGAAIGAALAARQPMAKRLERCAEAMVAHLDASFARIWTVAEGDPTTLVLQASAGLYTHIDGQHGTIPVGSLKIGRIAAERRPHLTNSVVGDPEVHDQEWARQNGMVAFAGYPLLVGDRLVGVAAMFARHPLGETTLAVLNAVVDTIALGIDRDRVEASREQVLEREQAARRSAEAAEIRYRGLFEGVADAILVADEHRRYKDANVAATTLLGYGRDELLQLRVEDVVANGPVWTREEYDRFVAGGQWQGELTLRRKDGTTLPVEARATIVDLPEGPVFLSAIRDTTQRMQLELLQRDFLAMVTHDLRSPLTALRGWAQMLQRRGSPDDRSQHLVARILGQTDQMERLISDLADLVRLEAGQLPLRHEMLDLAEVAREQAHIVQEQAEDHTIRVIASDRPVVGAWDRRRLGQVFQNLLTNAVKYSPDGGTVLVRIEAVDGEARIEVADKGVGIPPDHLSRLFERFYRADATGAGGLGLGLHISQMLVQAHHGRIWVSSMPGQGSTFSVALPMNLPEAVASPSPC